MSELPVNLVKVFSATKARERNNLGDAVTAWLAAHPAVTALRATVLLSSDNAFHCLSIVLVGHDGSAA